MLRQSSSVHDHSLRDISALTNPVTVAATLMLVVCVVGRWVKPLPQSTSPELLGSTWELVRFQSGDGQTFEPANKTKYTLDFGTKDTVTVQIGCNSGRAEWKWRAQNQIEFGPLALTRGTCPPSDFTDRLREDWQYLRSYTLKGGHLFLSSMADDGFYEFEPPASDY